LTQKQREIIIKLNNNSKRKELLHSNKLGAFCLVLTPEQREATIELQCRC